MDGFARLGRDTMGKGPQLGIERHERAPALLAVEQRAFGHRSIERFLQADGLGAELHLVGAVALGLAALVLDRERRRRAAVQLHDIGLARHAQGERAKLNAARDAHPGPALSASGVDLGVQQPPFRRGAILRP
nr:hypothetical protein [Phenylobacterium sp.]